MDRRYYCRWHPSHKQSKGVCPYCLRERLSSLTASSTSSITNLSNSSASSSSPCSPGLGDLSPPRRPCEEEARKEKESLKKSRSLAFVMDEEEEKEKKKKRKFWSKFMGRRREEGDGGLPHSKTMKEKASTKWAVFT